MKTPITPRKAMLSAAASILALIAGCTSVEEIQRKADAGDKEMQYDLAVRYREGDGIQLNKEKADEYLKKSFENGYIPAACEIAKEIHEKRNIEESEKLMKCYDVIFGSNPLDVSSILAQKKFSYAFPKMSQVYYLRLVEEKKEEEALKYKKCILRYLNSEYCPTTTNIESYRQALNQNSSETEEQENLSQNIAGQPSTGQFSGDGIKLFKSIYSGLSVKKFIQSMKFPEMICEGATRLDEDGTMYRINTYGSGKVGFLAGFNGVIGGYQVNSNALLSDAPEGYLFGVICSFGGDVTADALEAKIKKDFPGVEEKPVQEKTEKYSSTRGIDYDVITVTKTWESERVKATIHFVKLVFPDKNLTDAQKKDETARLLDGFRWTDDKIRGERIEKGMPLSLDGKSMIIVDKKMESKIQEFAKEAKQKHLKELEETRKKAEQKALDF